MMKTKGMVRLGRAMCSVCALGLGAVFGLGTASAQDGGSVELDVQNFRPAVGPDAIFSVEGSGVLGHLRPSGGMMLNYASEPLVEEPPNGPRDAIIDQQLAAHVYAGMGLWDRLQLDLALPVYFVNDGLWQGEQIEGAKIGDLSFRPKGMILSSESGPVGLGAQVDLTLPTGAADAFVGEPSVQVSPKVIADSRFANVKVAMNLGVDIREDREIRNLDLGERLTYGLGAEADFLEGLLRVGAELQGATELTNPFGDGDESPLEGLVGAKVVTPSGFRIMGAAGGGLVPGYGTPDFRALLGLSWAQGAADTDGDGITDVNDACPKEREDYDGFEDQDGCADVDNDEDGIEDNRDRCPDEAGPEENDGCPPGDDPDGDGIVEGDECPEEAEDKDGFQDSDGCPELDNDEDGVEDENDVCPGEKEDQDGFQDDDGCPDVDNDLDGLADVNDACPNEPGLQVDKGCPPEVQKVVRRADRLEILEKVFFESDKAVLKAESTNLLQQIGLLLRTSPDIRKVEVQGHTDSNGNDEYNKMLSQDRAEAVRQFLIEDSEIAPERLTAVGYGEEQPIDAEGASAKNRRVEFRILEQDEPTAKPEEEAVEGGEAGSGDEAASGEEAEEAEGEAESSEGAVEAEEGEEDGG